MNSGSETTGRGEKPICCCPFCDTEIVEADPFCGMCHITILYCSQCKKPRGGDLDECPECGSKLEPYPEKEQA